MTDPSSRRNQTTRALGRIHGRSVHLAVRADPSLEAPAPASFAVTLFVPSHDGRNVVIARIDTSDAGVHFDRRYLPVDHPRRKDYGIQVTDHRAAQRCIVDRWRTFAELYAATPGWPGDGASSPDRDDR